MMLFNQEQLERAEAYLADEKYEQIAPAFEGMVADMETYIDENCVTTPEVQWFSFETPFELLSYQRVEQDPRHIKLAERPFDRAYADLAFCYINAQDFERAADNLKKAVRWNPMNCAHRLNLAGVLTRLGDLGESLRLSFSVFARASRSAHLVRAYDNFAQYFINCEQYETAAACVKCALKLNEHDKRATEFAKQLADEHQADPAAQADELTESLLDAQGIPEGANVEVVLSALLLADIAGARGDMQTCGDMAQVAVDLVGRGRAEALSKMVSEAASEQYPEEVSDTLSSSSDAEDPHASATLDAALERAQAQGGARQVRRAAKTQVDAQIEGVEVPAAPTLEELAGEGDRPSDVTAASQAGEPAGAPAPAKDANATPADGAGA